MPDDIGSCARGAGHSAPDPPAALPCLLSSPVPPDSRKRRVVGHRLYGVAERCLGTAAVSWPLPASYSSRPRLLRSALGRGAREAGRAGVERGPGRIHLLALLVPRTSFAPQADRRGTRFEKPRLSLLLCLGQPGLDTEVDRRGRADRNAPGVFSGRRSCTLSFPYTRPAGRTIYQDRRPTRSLRIQTEEFAATARHNRYLAR